METIHQPQFPSDLTAVHVALFIDVFNAAALKARIVRAATLTGPEGDAEREALNFAFVDASLITSALHLQTAISQASLAAAQNTLRTKTVHSEILWALCPTNNISEAIRRYGISDTSKALFVVRVDSASVGDVEERMRGVVEGRVVPLSTLAELVDWQAVKKYNKLNTEPAVKKAANVDAEHAIIDNIVISSVASKGVMA
ncbi:CGI-121-domain-containing protein [Coniophora puteana RWD-64-598 SS2]|uniref:EKC/KEOPS complex subunit CGI121 n=1 Tax=Coniophora puteana (strain RWD-64-598) TaxID=741705 RepID=A0A5M3MTA1_CONPW|nr:CGI-121-domain-containing protein [Coniophora puteana RWD-64-598 SS2]EIW81984.1 CGI-121-domain-containing protein [Coniophora puteana RWD-64-598 SS2]